MLNTGRPSFWRGRDPRTKWLIFILFLVSIYIVPSWEWMLGATLLGLVIAITARAPLGWLALMLLIHTPTILALVVIPALGSDFALNAEFEFGLRISLGWVAAILIGVGLFSTMEVDELVEGLQGVGVPQRFAFLVGYAFVLIYLSVSDLTKVIESTRLKGIDITIRKPLTFLRNVPRLFIPALLTIVRRGGSMTAALETRGFEAVPTAQKRKPMPVIDLCLLALSLATVLVALIFRMYPVLQQG
ncbi:MAG: energy-coupling factor transporter transmembrane component T [Pseudomonadota bacterium]